ncbi:AraC family transcriptional regulator [Azospirillum sp. B4]|uniref:AraC family transcriptional regulator n=1 Tax=Azospirillum sp. B4 TaxID=95605 RepID=UPI00034DE935|nr:AraC family transcriptional regulator [Azospirillum sp. B4]
MDPLSDVLSLLKPRSYAAGGFDCGPDISIQFHRHDGIKCYAVVSGACWLEVEGAAAAVRLTAGDCFLLPRGWPFRLASDLSLPSIDSRTLFPAVRRGGFLVINGGGGCFIVGGHFAVDGRHAGILLAGLPPIIHIRDEADRAALRWSMDRMRQELRDPQPGAFLMTQHLAQMMLVQALRAHLAQGAKASGGGDVGWLFALADPRMGAAIAALHADPARRWTLQALAAHVGMSRSSFALRFKGMVGTAPMEYLARWRMLLAGDRLAHGGEPVSTIALSLGYESESAFSTAFKRVMGCSPRQYGRGAGQAVHAPEWESRPAPALVAE